MSETTVEAYTVGAITYGMVVTKMGCAHELEPFTGTSKVPMVRCRVCDARGLQRGASRQPDAG